MDCSSLEVMVKRRCTSHYTAPKSGVFQKEKSLGSSPRLLNEPTAEWYLPQLRTLQVTLQLCLELMGQVAGFKAAGLGLL